MSLYAGGSVWFAQFDDDFAGSFSDNITVLFGGLQMASGALAWTLGGQIALGDDTEFGIVLGANMNQGVNAIRSFFRR